MIPESVLKKQKRNEERALAKKQEIDAKKKKNSENWKLIYSREAGDTHSFISFFFSFFLLTDRGHFFYAAKLLFNI